METLKTAIQWTARKTEQKIAQKLANSAAKSADRICIAGHRGVFKFFSFDFMNAEPIGSAFFLRPVFTGSILNIQIGDKK